ncbi:hypothetical protein J5I95_15850 [Candidatus Poribacteria bacterium]|nr:hypothetical protein [Candidatus Poribacteria bacterium]
MKYILATLLLLTITMPAMAELSQNDLEQIQKIVDKSETRIKEYVDLKIDNLEKNVNQRFADIDKRITDARNLTYALIALIGVIVGIPAWRNRKDNHTLEKQIEILAQDIETLKQHIQAP